MLDPITVKLMILAALFMVLVVAQHRVLNRVRPDQSGDWTSRQTSA